jgi:hypothetical protein
VHPQEDNMDRQSKNTSSRISSDPVAKLNNQGVALLESGDFKNAINAFSCALKSCKVVACREDQNETDTHSLDEYITLSNNNLTSEDNNTIITNDDGGVIDDDHQVIYRQAIVVPESRNEVTEDHAITATMMAIIIVFNDAIAHHLWALEIMAHRGDNKKDAFKKTLCCKAARLYEIGLALAEDADICSPSSLFVLANINNMALVCKAMNANEVASRCLEQLLATLMVAIDCGERIEFDGFFANTSGLIFSAAPAAAA